MVDAINGEPREVTLYTDGKGRWLKRVWAAQCPEMILLNDQCQGVGGTEYRQKVFDYIEREDSPRPVTYQLDLLRRVGFTHVELLHKNSCFAAFGAWKE